MGFKLGHAIGKAFGSAIGTATHGAVRVNFARPSRPAVAPDSTVTYRNIAGGLYESRQVQYYGGGGDQVGGQDIGGPGYAIAKADQAKGACAMVWNGHRYVATHLNKSGYVTRGGGTSRWPQGLQFHPPGSVCVKHRRLNPANGHAAIRALHRITATHRLLTHVNKTLQRIAGKAHTGRRTAHPRGCGCKKCG